MGTAEKAPPESMKKAITFAAIFSLLLASPGVYAHQPRLAGAAEMIEVSEPEISKAYYGELAGKPAVYKISSAKPFQLYVGLLVPDMPGIETDISAEISKDGELLNNLYGPDFFWMNFYEPFADDYYLEGPEFDSRVEAGSYIIKVHSPDNAGKYVLAIGKKERFGFSDTIDALGVLPKVKKEFFGKSPYTAYNNYFGLTVLIFLAITAILIYLAIAFYKRRQAKKIIDDEYKKSGRFRGGNGL